MKLSEEQLYRTASIADNIEMTSLPDKESCPKHIFSEKFENDMRDLMHKVKNNEIKPYQVHMGWQFYTKRGAAAILLALLLTCAVMPDVVMAGYQKLIEVMEKIVVEYTEYRYKSHASADTKFVEMQLHYIPEGMREVERDKFSDEMNLVYEDNLQYFVINQERLSKESELTYIIDTEDAERKEIMIQGGKVQLVSKKDWTQFIWVYSEYLITGESNLSCDEIKNVLEGLEIKY